MSVKEIVFISGKGGTGKTTLTSSFIPYLKNIIIADCDVDAPDLDILLQPEILIKEDFIATSKAVIDKNKCNECGACSSVCNFNAIKVKNNTTSVRESFCEGCKTCTLLCPENAIDIVPYKTGEIFESETVYGSMIHGRLTPGEEVSGRLVSEIRKRAKRKAEETGAQKIIIDGPPGIACNVISAITGVSLAVIVTEPTVSGFHDLIRVYDTADKLSVPTAVIINKYGLSDEYTQNIEDFARLNGIPILERVELDRKIVQSVNKKKIPDLNNGKMVNKIEELLYS